MQVNQTIEYEQLIFTRCCLVDVQHYVLMHRAALLHDDIAALLLWLGLLLLGWALTCEVSGLTTVVAHIATLLMITSTITSMLC